MKFYTHQHQFYCGLDRPAKSLSVCILDQAGVSLPPHWNPTGRACLMLALDLNTCGPDRAGAFGPYARFPSR
jgi:hypothetical protein